MKGTAIWLNKAFKDYNIPQQTINRWVKSNIIERLSEDGYRVFVNEQDVAYCAEVYHKFGSHQLQFYKERWKAVEEIERQKLCAITLENHWRQLYAIARFAIETGVGQFLTRCAGNSKPVVRNLSLNGIPFFFDSAVIVRL